MRRRQAAGWFAFTAIVGLVRVLAYAGTPVGLDLSLAALVRHVAVHALAFAFAVLVVVGFSRATLARAGQVALYAQFALFLAPFVDLALAWPAATYGATYAVVGGTPGGIVASLAFGGVLAWGVHGALLGPRRARDVLAAAAGIGGGVGLGLVVAPWPEALVAGLPPWSIDLYLLAYEAALALVLTALAIRLANPALFREAVRRVAPVSGIGFALLPLAGIVAAGRLALPPGPMEPAFRVQVEVAYALAAGLAAIALWIQWRIVRADWPAVRLEAAAVAKAVALGVAATLGPGAFLAAGAAGSLAWLGARRGRPLVLGAVAGFAVLLGDLTVLAVEFATVSVGPAAFAVPIAQAAWPSPPGLLVATVVGVAISLGAVLTSRTSA